ncbi:nitrous oxide reductase accessory protein NosL [Rufibacter sp. DG15C]|uniref:nitrous oxide reductase accessory protein NosL n=1 Tax=Rufibacter sp. DG15C TaxID=1379909 RepID=UPI001E5F61D2|nr:nitrous oxide reductase accessory protein NosL [Rufibacter sp. DG15C]
MSVALASCSKEPQAIPYGSANCVHCNMTVADNRFGAELVNDKGKPYFFDSSECLMAYVNEHAAEGDKAAHLLVTDYTQTPTLINAQEALFLQSKAIASPMGMHLVAIKSKAVAAQMQQEQDGRILTWNQALEAVQKNERPE